MTVATKRPDMRDYFRARIAHHTHGMLAGSQASMPQGVRRVRGDVDSSIISVEMEDGTEYGWTGGGFSSRKVHGCYAPLMPKPAGEPRKASVFAFCDRHAGTFGTMNRRRMAECFVEGGIGGTCEGGTCSLKPGSDFYATSLTSMSPAEVAAELTWTGR